MSLPDKLNLEASAAFSHHRLFSILLLALVGTVLSFGVYLIVERARPLGLANSKPPVPVIPPPLPKPQLTEIVDTFKAKQTITDALVRHGVSSQEVFEMVGSARRVYNLSKIKTGDYYWLYLSPEGQFRYFNYLVDEEKYLTIYRDQENRFVPVMKPIRYDISVEPVSGVIEDSLFMSMLDAGEQEGLALELAGIFGCDIDFYTDIRKGDSYRLLVEKRYLNGEFKNYQAILAASITNQGKQFFGFRFEDVNGKPAYYGSDGKALKKSFLKSPLKFARITSRFSRARLHPILKIVRPHLGVDYAAPVGTPVQAVGGEW